MRQKTALRGNGLTLCRTIPTLNYTKEENVFENIVGKGKNAGYQHFLLLFPKMFSTIPKTNFNFSVSFISWSANAFNLDQFKNLSFGLGLTHILSNCDC